jgi:chemotaxis protein MotB
MKRRGNREEQGSAHEAAGMMRWLLTYSDMITLLLAFFIVLYALSAVNHQKYESLMRALRAVLHGKGVTSLKIKNPSRPPYPPNSSTPTAQERKLLSKAQLALYRELERVIHRDNLESSVHLDVLRQGIEVEFLNGVLFPLGSANLSPQAERILTDIAGPLRGKPNAVVVQGYTDDLPISTPEFLSNWDLSAVRAARVVDYWTRIGLDPRRFLIEGFGQYSPFAPNSTAAGRQKNRRADALILNRGVLGPTNSVVTGAGARSPP